MSKFAKKGLVRQSKVRHIFGKDPKKSEETFDDLRISKNSWDAPFCAVNPKFLAVCLQSAGGGAFIVLPLSKTGRVELDASRVAGHGGDVLDLAWNPFDDNIIASSSEDMKVMIWEIPDVGLTHTISTPLLSLEHHQRRVGIIRWHPVASNIILSASHDNSILVWNIETAEIVTEIDCHPDITFSVSWNYNGSLIATTCKDKKLRIIDPRSGEVKKEVDGHEGSKPQQISFLGKFNYLFTTGFSRMSERQYGVWNAETLEKLTIEEIDSSNGVQFIRYDPDTCMIYLIGKGDCLIRYYEVVEDEPYVYWITNFQAKDPQKGFGFMPKRGCNVSINEVAKIFRLTGSIAQGCVMPTSFTCPRKSELFQTDLFPDTISDEPSLTADEWLSGKNADPKLMSLKENFKSKGKVSSIASQKSGLAGIKGKLAAKKKGDEAEDMDINKLLATVKKLTQQVADLEKRTESLEGKMEKCERECEKECHEDAVDD